LRLRENLALNGISNVEVLDVAAWDCHTILSLSSANRQVRDATTRALPGGPTGDARGVPLDELLAGEDRIDVVKVDAGGEELHVLRGMAGTLARCRPVLFIEDHSPSGAYVLADLMGLLVSLGYEAAPAGTCGGVTYFTARPVSVEVPA